MPYGPYDVERRRIEVAKLIKSRKMTTSKQLASHFGVTTKTILNDKKALEDKWQVQFDDSHKGKFEITDLGLLDSMLNSSKLNAEEVNIILASLVQCKAFMPARIAAIESALLSTLNDKEKNKLKSVLKTEDGDSRRNDQLVIYYIKKIREGILEEKKLEIRYKTANGSVKTIKVIPYTLACDLGKYYLVCKDENKESLGNYRLDRMKDVKVLNEPGKRTPEFNVDQYLRRTWYMYSDPETKIRVKFDKGCFPAVDERNMIDGELIEWTNDECFIYEFTAYGTKGILIWLLGFAEGAEVLSPPELREEFKERIRKMAERYR